MGKSKKEPISQKKKMSPFSPVHIKEGEILSDINGKNWRIGKSVGSGGFGEIYLVSDDVTKSVTQDAQYAVKIEPHKNGPLFVEMNFYLRVAKKEMIDQWKKNRGLKHLGMPYYIAFGSHVYQNEKFRFLILKKFGQDLGKLFSKCKRKFHIKTVLTLGIQILDILEYIHSHGYIHADIKDSNLLLGTGRDDDNVYLLDYGLACRYVDGLGAHKEYNPDQRKAHDGTLQYTSRDAHIGAHSRRSDLEVLAYNMIHWLCGWLPWEDEISDPEKVAEEKQNYMSNIPSFLKKCFGDEPPVVLSHFLKYVDSLRFETKPDYDYCKTLLRQGIRQAGYADDGKLNFSSPPAKLKSRKRIRSSDIENLVELKPVKIPRNVPRQPCVPVQANCNRITRQQTAANTLALRSREIFDWVKVLQSNPEKILKSQNIINDQEKKKRVQKHEQKPKCVTVEVILKKEKENPLENPTPAMCEVLKLRASAMYCNTGRRTRSESHCSSPVFYDNSTLTPAMEEVIRRRDAMQKSNLNECTSKLLTPSSSGRSNRLKNRNENFNGRAETRKVSEAPEIKRVTRKTSVPETKTPDLPGVRKRTRKYSLQEQKLMTEFDLESTKKKNLQKESRRRKITTRKTRRGFPTRPKSPNKKSLGFSTRRKVRREVSPSEIDFVPRLRSGFDNSDYFVEKMLACSISNQKIRNYAANSGPSLQCRKRRCGIDYSRLSPSVRDSSILL